MTPVKLDATERQEKLQPLINKGDVKQKSVNEVNNFFQGGAL